MTILAGFLFVVVVALAALLLWQRAQLASERRLVAQLERKLARMQETLTRLQTAPPPATSSSNIEQLAEAGEELDPLKFTKRAVDMGLREARGTMYVMDKVTRRLLGQDVNPAQARSEALRLLRAQRRGDAITFYRQAMGVTLREAQKMVDTLADELKPE
jgi:ribosomal protein L7/L12